MKKVFQKTGKRMLAWALSVSMLASGSIFVSAQEPSTDNLALNKAVTASAQYSTMPASYLTDADEDSRWSTESNATQWAYVDLGESLTMNYFSMIWESADVYASSYNIYVSDNTEDWGSPVVARTDNTSAKSEETLSTEVSGRYVKLEVTGVHGYPSVSCRDFKVKYLSDDMQDPNENVARGKKAVASSEEAGTVAASNAVDGDTSSRSSRWGSNVGDGPHWIYVDLGKEMNVQTIKIFWENRKATAYKVQLADTLGSPMEESDWTDAKVFTERPAGIKETVTLDSVQKARYVRLYIDSFTAEDPDGGVEWNTVSIYELEVYGGIPVVTETMDSYAEGITVDTPSVDDEKLTVHIPESDTYTAVYNGTDYEQIVDDDLTIYRPLVDTKVKVSFKITEKDTEDWTENYSFKEVEVTVPGIYRVEENDNEKPSILPELREWKGGAGEFRPTDSSKIIIADESYRDVAEELASDYEELFGKNLQISAGTKSSAAAGDFYFGDAKETTIAGLKDEGYYMEIEDFVAVYSETTTGAYWATRTILQSLKQTGAVPEGKTRDYPLYQVRGFILDVGRKTFTMDYLKQVVKEMSWYKMNDFQVHLNDNLIPLENYTNAGEDAMQAYSGFRLESDIKKGGNDGLNQADLTSTDVFYTKDEFRTFIRESRVCGVNIVPEIDTPAHSLALTKVRPDLRHGTNGRENDHLNLTTKYDESFAFVKSIFDEYMGADLADPVFDEDTVVHIGADEYSADGNAYRRFSNDMISYVKESGRTPRIWGSLTSIRGDGSVNVPGEGVQMNLWNFGWANMDQMYEEGFDLINCNDGNYYIVPNAGYYYDYLNDGTLYNLPINSIGGITIPAGDSQMLGGAFAVWNDMTDYLDNGISEYDVFDRIEDAIPLMGAKLWGKSEDAMSLNEAKALDEELGGAPGTNFGYEVESADEEGAIVNLPMDDKKDASANSYDITEVKNASIEAVDGRNALKLDGDESYASTPLTTAGLGNDLRVKVKRTSDSADEQILFESSYGSIKAVQKETGKVGLSRENFDYSFHYELPVNEWVELEIKNQHNVVQLYVNGKLTDTLGDDERIEGRPMLATMMIPIEKIGSATNAFIGYVDDVRLGTNDDFASTMELDYAVLTAEALLKEHENTTLEGYVKQAEEIFAQYSADASAVEALAEKINDEIGKTDFEKADYSRIDAYKDLILEDMSSFTEESVENLNRALSSVRENLPASMQGTVDGYEAQLSRALAALEVKTKANINYVDNATITATASSYQDNGSAPNKVLDGDLSTMWHSKWSIVVMPHWIDLEMDEPTAISGITYITRQTGTNGNPGKYEIQVSDDGQNYTTVKEGTGLTQTGTYELTFDTVTTKHVRLVYLEAVNNNGSAAEIKVHLANVKADVEGLQAKIGQAEAIENNNYTEDSWNALQSKIQEAKTLAESENPDANDVEIMKRALDGVMVSLKLVEKPGTDPKPTVPDKTALESKIKEAEKAEADRKLYTEESYKTFETALLAARKVYEDADATEKEIASALEALTDAMDGLSRKPDDPVVIAVPYEDVNKGDWFFDYVYDVYIKKLMTGLDDKTFGPNQDLARAQFALILYRMEGQPKVEYSDKFPDVQDNIWYTDAILWAAENGIVTGYSDTGKFGPSDNITREQMAVMMYRYANYKGLDISASKSLGEFPDGDKVQVFAVDGMEWCTAKGIISGKGEEPKVLDPQGSTKRAECATIISRYTEIDK